MMNNLELERPFAIGCVGVEGEIVVVDGREMVVVVVVDGVVVVSREGGQTLVFDQGNKAR